MLEICNKKSEVDSPDNLTSKFAIFIVEFEYDNRVYVGHTIMLSVKTELRKFINSVLDDSIKQNVLLKESMKYSNTLYVSIKEPSEYTLDALFKLKYKTILLNSCYEPYGFNKIYMAGNAYEKGKGYTEVAEWPSITAAARHYSLNASNIAACCSGRLNTAYKRLWRYSD